MQSAIDMRRAEAGMDIINNLQGWFEHQKQLPQDKEAWQAANLVLSAAVGPNIKNQRLGAATAHILGVDSRRVTTAVVRRRQAMQSSLQLRKSTPWFSERYVALLVLTAWLVLWGLACSLNKHIETYGVWLGHAQ